MFGPRVVRRRPLLRAAVVGGTAYAAGRRSADARNAEAYQQSAQQAPAPAAQQGAPSESSMLDQLGRLNALHQQGALTDEEFAAAKAKLLG
ncbi:MAG TPA: SHOCT domain-containing protein [Streptosporangiaceae bacterium]|nr:SHOCT domain-containing protein [Streptosporangiaceae bacterium]